MKQPMKWLVFAWPCVVLAANSAAATEPAEQSGLVVRAVLDSAITSTTRDYILDAIGHAEESKAACLIVQMDTPGGLVEATRELVQAMLKTHVPIVVYVAPPGARAGSAGLFVTLAAHVAAMAPATHIGAAHPVSLFGGDVEGEMARKVENDAAAWARSLAQTRGRNADWAEKAVRESASIPANEALKKKVVDLMADDLDGLLAALDGRLVTVAGEKRRLHTKGTRVEEFSMSGRQGLVNFLASPNLLYFLFLLALFLLFLEFKNPGLIVPGVVGVLLIALVLGLQVLPVNWLGVLLILGAAALFVTEIYVTSFGLLSVGAMVCLIVGSYLLFDVPGSTFRVDPPVIWTVALTFAALLLGVGYLLVRAKQQGATSGVDAMVGEAGEVWEPISPEKPGKVRLRGAYWTASSPVELNKGAKVRVVKMDGTRAVVAPLDE